MADIENRVVARVRSAPWLAAPIEQLLRARAAQRFPTGLLIHDERGAGGLALSYFAAQLALCRQPQAPCGQCRDCRQFLAAQHPDFYDVIPIEESKFIRVEQIRELSEALSLTAHGGGASVAVLSPADSLNANAANALLKTLEEPRAGVTLILVSAQPSLLPATIVSRCQRLRVPTPSRAACVSWLEQHAGAGPWPAALAVLGNAPFEALNADPTEVVRIANDTMRTLDEAGGARADIPAIAERWARAESLELRLACFETWLTARIDEGIVAQRQSSEMGSGAHLPESSSDMNIGLALRLLDGVYELRRLRLSSINRSLALEQLLWQVPRVRRAPAPAASV